MRLSDYLDLKKETEQDFAARIGVQRESVRRYRAGERIPDKAVMQRIVEATAGAVMPNDFFGISHAAQTPAESEAA